MDKGNESFTIAVILGSVRSGNFTAKALQLVVDELKEKEHVHVDYIDPTKLSLPLPGTGGDSPAKGIQGIVAQSTGVIIATPEYHGSYSSVIKLVIDNLGFPSVLSGKPVALLGVAAGAIGAIKALEHLRSVCSHVGAIVLPGPVSIAGVNKVFNEAGQCTDEKTEQRIRALAQGLCSYIRDTICPRKSLEEFVRK